MSGLGKWPLDTGLSVVFISLSRIITTPQAVRTSLTFLQKWPFFARGDKVVLYKNGTDSLHVFVLLKNGDFFLRFGLPSTRIHWKRSPKAYLLEREKFWKRRFAVLMWMGENKGFVKTIVFFVKTMYVTLLETSKCACSDQRLYRTVFHSLLRFRVDERKW